MRKFSLLLVLLVLLTAAGTAHAAYPNRPITIICPFAAGGGTDAVARILATLLQEELGVPVNIVNRTGDDGVIGHRAILSSRADGYTIGLGSVDLAMFSWMGLAPFTASNFTPIAGINLDMAAITVPAGTWDNYAALMADVRASRGQYTASGTTAGGIWHLAMASWLVAEGLPANHVRWIPSAGAAPAQKEMMAGGVNMVTCSLAEVSELAGAGKAKVLAYMGEERSPKFPDVPTMKELGVFAPNVGAWRGIVGPNGMPQEAVRKLEETLAKIIASREFIEFMEGRGFGIRFLPSKEWGEFMIDAEK